MFRCARGARGPQTRLALAVALLSLVAPIGNRLFAVEGSQVVRVEEFWELEVGTPDSATSGPQISCTISPRENLDGRYSIFTLNHRSHPSFAPGGSQLQIWNGETTVEARNHPNTALLATTGESIKWTMKMSLSSGQLVFDVDDGVSTTWGNFGTNGHLWSSVSTNLTNLNGYDPAVSVANSGVNFASNRVQSLVLKKVRLVLSTGEVLEDTTARVVHQLDQ